MNIEQYKKAKEISEEIIAIDQLIADNEILSTTSEKELDSYKQGFQFSHNAYKQRVSKHKDGSGPHVDLTYDEILELQMFTKLLLERRRFKLINKLAEI